MGFSKILLGGALALSMATGAMAQPSPGQANGQYVHNVVLVHGAFVDGSGWRGVYDDLTARGYTVKIVQIPLTSLADDAAATTRVLDGLDGPAILVGHSWGGTVVTQTGTHSNVAGLVYVSALIPDANETTAQQYKGYPAAANFVLDIGEDGFAIVKSDRFKEGFAADIGDADAAFLRDSQLPIRMSSFEAKVTNAAWRSRPAWAVIAEDDQAFGKGMLQGMARRAGARITEVPGSHALFITQASAVANVIDDAARATSKAEARSR